MGSEKIIYDADYLKDLQNTGFDRVDCKYYQDKPIEISATFKATFRASIYEVESPTILIAMTLGGIPIVSEVYLEHLEHLTIGV